MNEIDRLLLKVRDAQTHDGSRMDDLLRSAESCLVRAQEARSTGNGQLEARAAAVLAYEISDQWPMSHPLGDELLSYTEHTRRREDS